jgi:hypothetical protein
VLDRLYGRSITGFREQLMLPLVSPRELRRRGTAAERPILYGYSPTVLPRPAEWQSGLEVVGFWWPARPTDWQPPAELVRFLDHGPAPVPQASVAKIAEHVGIREKQCPVSLEDQVQHR